MQFFELHRAANLVLRIAAAQRQISHTTMKTLSFLLIIGFIVTAYALAADAPAKDGELRHVVAFKFKDTATKQQIKEVEDGFRALKGKIPEIVSSAALLAQISGPKLPATLSRSPGVG